MCQLISRVFFSAHYPIRAFGYGFKQESIMPLSFPNVFIGNPKKYGYPVTAIGYDRSGRYPIKLVPKCL